MSVGMMLRPYQEEARRSVKDAWLSGIKRTLLVLPTGTGKTIVFAKITEDCVRKGKRVLILAHRGELLDQAAEKLRRQQAWDVQLKRQSRAVLIVGSM